ncbi:hypothetical protein LX36DRAFT_391163 [Colletotrichum falcatum]|nr:hypothetical protein LX36DRAFT_391163 [Colletotrichum falcatum]
MPSPPSNSASGANLPPKSLRAGWLITSTPGGSANGSQPISTDVARLRHHRQFFLSVPSDASMHTRTGRNRGKTLRQASKRERCGSNLGRTPALVPTGYIHYKRAKDPWLPSNHIFQLNVSIRASFIRRLRHPPSHLSHSCLGPPSWARWSVGLSGHPDNQTDDLKLRGAGTGQDEEFADTQTQRVLRVIPARSKASTVMAGIMSFSGHGNVEVDRDKRKKKNKKKSFRTPPPLHFLPTPSSLLAGIFADSTPVIWRQPVRPSLANFERTERKIRATGALFVLACLACPGPNSDWG